MKLSLGLACILLAALAPAATQAQDPPIRWGKIPEEHLRMEHFPADTNASVVVLADYGTVHFERDNSLRFRRHTRIKILTEAGYDWGTVTISYHAGDRLQRVRGVGGQTFTIGDNGRVERHKMGRKAVFKEDVDGRYQQIRFTLPALQPGAVIEYRYEVHSKSPVFVPEWSFQQSEPVLWSEFRPQFPQTLAYVQATRGILNFHIQEEERIVRPGGDATQYRLVMKDVPALREEPFMTTPANYRARLEFQLASYYQPGFGARNFLQTWAAVAEELMDSHGFGRQLDRPRRRVREQVETLTAGIDAPVMKVRALYDYVRSNIAWDGRRGYFLNRDLDDVLKTQKGSRPEMALLLVSMLREAGLTADPVLISTRSHGHIVEQYPLLRQFNDILVHAVAGGETFLLDPTDPLRPYDLLPYESLNGRGWLVRKEGAQWIDVVAFGKYVHQAHADARLAPDGTLSGTLRASDTGYSALYKRRKIEEDGTEQFVRDVLLDGLHEVALDSHRVDNVDDVDEVLSTTAGFSVPAYAQAAGDFLYVNPFVVDRTEENPLRLPERTFPVDFGYGSDVIYSARLVLPEGYAVEEVPAYQRIPLPGGGGAFTRSVEVTDGVLTVQARLARTKTVFEPRYYDELRAFYERLVAAQSEPVVLRREAAPLGTGAGEPSGGER